MVVRFISVPLFLQAWNAKLYGEWLILHTILSYFSLGNLGFAQAAANEMTMFVAKNDRDKALITYQTSAVVLVGISFFLISLAVFIAYVLPLGKWMGLELITGSDFRIIVLIFAVCVLMVFLVNLLLAGYRCEGKYHRGIIYYDAMLLADFGALVVILVLGMGPLFVSIAMLAVRIIIIFVMIFDLKIAVPWLRLGFRYASTGEFRRILSPSLYFLAIPTGQILINQGVIIAIGAIIGPIAVVLFNSLRIFTNMVSRVFDLVNHAFLPEVSIARGLNNTTLIRRLHRRSCQLSFWLCFLSVIGLFFLGPWFFEKWTQGKIDLDRFLFWAMLGQILLRSIWYTSYIIPSAINRHQKASILYLLSSVLGLIVSSVALNWALTFVVAGFVVVDSLMIAYVVRFSLRLSNDKYFSFFKAILKPPNPIEIFKLTFSRLNHGR